MRTIFKLFVILYSMTATGTENNTGVIGRIYENDLPVIYAFDRSDPTADVIASFPWLTIVSWKYDGSNNNGMPLAATNTKMLNLEDALSQEFEKSPSSIWVFNRTGNHLKEFVYYIADQDLFLKQLNRALSSHPKYPIDVKFYNDSTWSEFKNLLSDFRYRK